LRGTIVIIYVEYLPAALISFWNCAKS